jgi:hypothetical protein
MSEARETVDLSLSRLSLSLSFPLYNEVEGSNELPPMVLTAAALLKLLVEGNCLMFVCEGGILDPWILTIFPPAPCIENTEPKGVVARCMSSAGGGDEGLWGGPSLGILRSGIKFGGGIVFGGGGSLGGGGSVSIGGFDLSEELSRILVVADDGTRERTGSSIGRTPAVPAPVPTRESIDCRLSEAVMRLPTEPVAEVIEGSRKIEDRGDEAGAIAGGVNTGAGADCGGGGGGGINWN